MFDIFCSMIYFIDFLNTFLYKKERSFKYDSKVLFNQIIIFNTFTNTNEMSHFKDNIINLLMKKKCCKLHKHIE